MIRIEIDHWNLIKLAKEKPENYLMLRAAKPELPTVEDMVAGKGWVVFDAFINSMDDLPEFVFEIAKFVPIRPLKLMVDGRINTKDVKLAMTTAQVHLPGNELLKISEVHVEEDCCTDHLNDMLKTGWKIIAVCPQPSRRPDYILGKGQL